MSREKEDRMPYSEFQRKALLRAATCLIFTLSLPAQSPPSSGSAPAVSTPAYDVATIKLHEGILSMTGLINRPDGISGSAATLSEMVSFAYGVRSDDQVSGGPGWAK